jgi:hypothetical protein
MLYVSCMHAWKQCIVCHTLHCTQYWPSVHAPQGYCTCFVSVCVCVCLLPLYLLARSLISKHKTRYHRLLCGVLLDLLTWIFPQRLRSGDMAVFTSLDDHGQLFLTEKTPVIRYNWLHTCSCTCILLAISEVELVFTLLAPWLSYHSAWHGLWSRVCQLTDWHSPLCDLLPSGLQSSFLLAHCHGIR